ncbi:WD repeat-containing protein 6 [Trichuris trichiura]|uniref:WD repeat-containing protein 6 n=1 Tax=Trichuris trichiura TaxID=36087 RepID=A0A077ZMP0_TRITR|nr:WD repeat-containing protein 6 [Trichuris trichiura]
MIKISTDLAVCHDLMHQPFGYRRLDPSGEVDRPPDTWVAYSVMDYAYPEFGASVASRCADGLISCSGDCQPSVGNTCQSPAVGEH